jgi:hypothetical protein
MTLVKTAMIQWVPTEEGGRRSGPPPGPQYSAPAKFLAHLVGVPINATKYRFNSGRLCPI